MATNHDERVAKAVEEMTAAAETGSLAGAREWVSTLIREAATVECPGCVGRDCYVDNTCPTCHGKGRIPKECGILLEVESWLEGRVDGGTLSEYRLKFREWFRDKGVRPVSSAVQDEAP